MISMNNFVADPVELLNAEIDAVARVIRSGWYVLGGELSRFEKEWASACGLPFATGVGNGMDAIEIGLRAMGIGPGDEVITTPMTAFASILAVIRAGAKPVLADIDETTALLDIKGVTQKITPNTKAVLLVHLYGQVRNMDEWQALCKQAGIHLLEDCAQAHLAKWNDKYAGGFGSWGAYSFYPTKNLGTAGDGGALVTASQRIFEQANILRNYGQDRRYYHSNIGLNSRLDEIHAAILSERLKYLSIFTERRKEIAKIYHMGIKNSKIKLLAQPLSESNHVYHLFVITTPDRDRLSDHLKKEGIENLIHYPVPMHKQQACEGMFEGAYPVAEKHAQECLSIPCHHNMSIEQADQVIQVLNAF